MSYEKNIGYSQNLSIYFILFHFILILIFKERESQAGEKGRERERERQRDRERDRERESQVGSALRCRTQSHDPGIMT